MSKEVKFTEEELKSLSDLAQGYQTTQAAFGQLRVQTTRRFRRSRSQT